MNQDLHYDLMNSIGKALHEYIDKLVDENKEMQHQIDYNSVYCEAVDSCRELFPDMNYNLIFNHPEDEIKEISTFDEKIRMNNETIEKLNQLFPQLKKVQDNQK